LESKINRITDILRRDDGISGAMHYTVFHPKSKDKTFENLIHT